MLGKPNGHGVLFFLLEKPEARGALSVGPRANPGQECCGDRVAISPPSTRFVLVSVFQREASALATASEIFTVLPSG